MSHRTRGMHVYAPGAAGYRPIAVTIAPQPFVQLRPLQYPPSEIYFFKPLNERVPVYQKPFRLGSGRRCSKGRTQAQAALQGKESLTLTGRVEYQACDDKVCFNPATVSRSDRGRCRCEADSSRDERAQRARSAGPAASAGEAQAPR